MMQYFTSAPLSPPPPPAALLPINGDGIGIYSGHNNEATSSSSKPNCLHLPQHHSWPWLPGLLSSSSSSSSSFEPSIGMGGSINGASCMEHLLVNCADAIETNDATLTQQIIWLLNNIAPPDGDSNQRLTSAFLRALIVRASKIGSCKMLFVEADADLTLHLHRFSAVDLASFIDLTPWHRFGFAATNAAIADAVEGLPVVHLVDLGTTHCMQMPTLIDLLARRPEGPPLLIRLTVPALTATTAPPLLDMSYDELGARLVNFARSRNITMEFRAVPSDPTEAFATLIEQIRVQQLVTQGEAVIVNCHMILHFIPDETAVVPINSSPMLSLRTMFLKALRGLEPALVTVVDEDAELTAFDVTGRLRAAFNYLWIPYDAVETCVAKGSEKRRRYEGGVYWKIENVIAQEGAQRVERQETKGRWAGRMRAAGFRSVGLTEDAAAEVKAMLDEHAAGWGMKRDDEDLMLTWKGHNVVFATAWIPAPPSAFEVDRLN
ncbi:scarecrow-like protein 32 [Curcuma longa]|uniref:scarecrow-like protein 32 n=1 Tax=Curcuma longa TaxID=136217 RepID=UPI003D9E4720